MSAITARPSSRPASSQNITRRAGAPDYTIMVTAIALVVIGLIFVYSASFAIALAEFDNPDYFLIRQTLSAVLAVGAMFFMMKFDYQNLRGISPILMLVTVL